VVVFAAEFEGVMPELLRHMGLLSPGLAVVLSGMVATLVEAPFPAIAPDKKLEPGIWLYGCEWN
jgi:hypothetical protein